MKEENIIREIKNEVSSLNIRKVLVAFSGGPDSVAATFALKKTGLEIIALHCNFHLRGEESDRDMEFVENFCKEHEIPLHIIHFDVEKYRKEKSGESIEMVCRKLRYEWFHKMLKQFGYDRIATGHNADDNIETFLLNMLRGSGSRGLKGMVEDNGTIWRPLLKFHRKDILEFIYNNNLGYVLDSTNEECDFRRNFLRNKIIPLLKTEWKGFDTAMDKTIGNLQSENEIVEKYLSLHLSSDTETLTIDKIVSFPAPLLLIKRFIEKAGPFSTTPSEILSAINAKKPHIKVWRLKKGEVYLNSRELFIKMSHGESRT